MSDTRGLAFFPWWAIDEPQSLGPVRLLPYRRRQAPQNLPHAALPDIDAALKAYSAEPNRRLKHATLLEVDDWQLGQDPTPALPRLFAARDAVGFAGLAGRSLFEGHFGYCGFDNYALVVRRYLPGQAGMFAFGIRRRDGGSQHVWSNDTFALHRPLHVDVSLRMPSIDADLVTLLMAPDLPAHWIEAVAEFNRANTDSMDVPVHVEMVMMKSAFELLLDIGPDRRAFRTALDAALDPCGIVETCPPGSLSDGWRAKYRHASRWLHAWAQEFCARRGAAAHGSRGGDHFVWSETAHLAFASVLFPLLLKQLAANSGRYRLAQEDAARLKHIDAYLPHDPMLPYGPDPSSFRRKHPWAALEQAIRMRAAGARRRIEGLAALEAGLRSVSAQPLDAADPHAP